MRKLIAITFATMTVAIIGSVVATKIASHKLKNFDDFRLSLEEELMGNEYFAID